MTRGTTPTFVLSVSGIDVQSVQSLYVTLAQGAVKLTKTQDDIVIIGGKIQVYLTQSDTLKFQPGAMDIQIRGVSESGNVFATSIKRISVNPILLDGVIT